MGLKAGIWLRSRFTHRLSLERDTPFHFVTAMSLKERFVQLLEKNEAVVLGRAFEK